MKKLFFACVVTMWGLSNTPLFAQTLNLDNIKRSYKRGNGAIVKNNQVNGYYFFYLLEKVDKKTNLYRLIITDNDFNQVASKDLEGPSNLVVIDAAYNENNLAIKFVDANRKDATQKVRVFDNNANEVKSYTYPYDLSATLIAYNMKTADELETTDLHPIDGIGFINVTNIQTKGGVYKRTGINLDMITESPGFKKWQYQTPEKLIETPDYLGNNEQVAFFSIARKEKLMSRDVDFTIAAFDLKTGEKRFDKEFKDDKYQLDVVSINGIENSNETLLFGSLMEGDKKTSKAKTIGMYIAQIDNDGNVKNKSTFLWKDIAKDFNPVDDKGKPVDIGSVFIHKVITTADGKTYAIGERFYKAASALGIASNVLGAMGGNSPTNSVVKIVADEMIILEIGKDLKPVSIEIIEKGKNSTELPAGAGMMGTVALGYYAKMWGGFDYNFTQMFDDKEGFTVVFKSSVRKENAINTYTVLDGIKSNDKINLKTEASKLFVYPAKAGYLAILEYFKKEKKISTRLEKYKH